MMEASFRLKLNACCSVGFGPLALTDQCPSMNVFSFSPTESQTLVLTVQLSISVKASTNHTISKQVIGRCKVLVHRC